jgi:nucleoside-diphosphate-sugar epimerase
MNIHLFGGNGIIGNGIYSILKKQKYKIKVFGSSIYNHETNEYILKKIPACDILIFAAGVTNEEVEKKGYKDCKLRSTKSLLKLLTHYKKNGLKFVIYISTLRIKKSDNNKHQAEINKDLDLSYRLCHLNSENIIKNFKKKTKIKSLILRAGNTFGFPKKKKFNRKKLITYSFPLSVLKKNFIKLNTTGKQIRYFSSNYLIGKIVLKWIKNNKKRNFLIYKLFGQKMSVLEFSNICLNYYEKFKKKKINLTRKDNHCISLKSYLIRFYRKHKHYESN